MLGRVPMPWQQMTWDVGLELLEDGRPAYREVWISTPRQSGKTDDLLVVKLHRATMWHHQPQRIYYSAQTAQESRRKLLEDHLPTIQASPMKATVAKVYQAPGDTAIVFRTKSRIGIMGSSETAGHGRTADLGVLDEVFADLDDTREQAIKPAMATRPEAQLWGASTAGTARSAYLRRKVDNGRAAVTDGTDRGIAYFEFSAPDDADIENPATWYACMPALGYTITEDVVRTELQTMLAAGNEAGFRRAFLNQWTIDDDQIIPVGIWADISRADVVLNMKGLTIAVDMSPDRMHTSVVMIDNDRRAELTEYREGTSGVVERLIELYRKLDAPVAIDARGPASSLIPDLEFAGVDLIKYDSVNMPIACGRLMDALADRGLSVRSSSAMDLAVSGARKRVVIDQWVWARRDAFVDISPLVALTLAYDASVNIDRQGGTLWAASF
jgi:hypothetical protein